MNVADNQTYENLVIDGCSITIPSSSINIVNGVYEITYSDSDLLVPGAFPVLDVDGEAKMFMSRRIETCSLEESSISEGQTEQPVIILTCNYLEEYDMFFNEIATGSVLFFYERWLTIRLSVARVVGITTSHGYDNIEMLSVTLVVDNWADIHENQRGYMTSHEMMLDIVNPSVTSANLDEDNYIYHNNKFYYKPSANSAPQSFKIAKQETLLTINGHRNITFRNIHFRNNGIKSITNLSDNQAAYDNIGCINISGSENITFDNCEFSSIMGYCAIVGKDSSCTNIKFINCRVHDTFGGGFLFKNCEAGEVQNCLIKNYGLVMSESVGIILGRYAHDCLITKNTIHDGYYSGISIGWIWGYDSNHNCKNNTISYNHIHHCMKQIHDDGGGIYTLGMSEGTIIEKNVIHDIISRCGISAPAIYLDEGSSFIKCRNNVCYGCDMGFQLHYGYANEICNNIFAYCSSHVFRFGVPENLTPLDENLGFYAHNNLIYIDSGVLMEALREKCAYLFSHNLLDIELNGQVLSSRYDWIRIRKFFVGSLGIIFGSSAPLRLTMFGLETTQNPLPSKSINFFPIYSDSKGFHRIDILDTPGLYGISASMKSLYDSDQSNYANFEQQRILVTTNIQHYSSTYFDN
jgi:hypothetical protein